MRAHPSVAASRRELDGLAPSASREQLISLHGVAYVDELRSPDELLAEAQLRHAQGARGSAEFIEVLVSRVV